MVKTIAVAIEEVICDLPQIIPQSGFIIIVVEQGIVQDVSLVAEMK